MRAVIDLAHNLDIRVVAEGWSNTGQLQFLQKAGCDLAQGFLLSKPMAGSRVPGFLKRWQGTRSHSVVEPVIGASSTGPVGRAALSGRAPFGTDS